MAVITVRCPDNDDPVQGCGHIFDVDTAACDDMIDCPSCGLFFDPDHPNSQPQLSHSRGMWRLHLNEYERN